MADNNAIVSLFDEEADENMTITLEAGNSGHLCAHLKGRLDTANCAVFARRMKKALDAGYSSIVLECSALAYLSSAGVGALAALLKQAKEKGGTLALANVSDEIKELLKLLDFEQFFEMTDGVRTAPLPPAAFPLVVKCPQCGKALKVAKEGRYRCSNCKAIISVSASGSVALG